MLMSSDDRPATLIYGPSAFRMVKPGQFVTCAVTGERIDVEELTYWSVERQEPYASAQIATRRILDGE
ncbi:DUF2093 domain-containing protein [Altericroceibacterium endophyticum]|uniref:DUF2093 domain-containing protein n=1 Tax=Altericroceibacterium endophyticum TaxID=1808508 RepID=A0A6I4T408_9SPHN|nr:DUF2093 domain-containing protein [Altericroceibacterium endophyticum]MXO65586.1 DUF2093 domain-containing protein [Altericroceibacterium endophyticum]